MKDLSRYNVHFAICPELKFVLEQDSGLHYEVDTTQLQIASLLMFASGYGFKFQNDFSFKKYNVQSREWIYSSFDHFVKAHNNTHGDWLYPVNKLVNKVKLQRVKRTKKLVAQSMMVELV